MQPPLALLPIFVAANMHKTTTSTPLSSTTAALPIVPTLPAGSPTTFGDVNARADLFTDPLTFLTVTAAGGLDAGTATADVRSFTTYNLAAAATGVEHEMVTFVTSTSEAAEATDVAARADEPKVRLQKRKDAEMQPLQPVVEIFGRRLRRPLPPQW